MPKRPPTPAGLAVRGAKLWRDVTGDYQLRVDELRVLEDACREVDLIEQLEDEQRGADLVVPGYNGQPTAAPMLGELRAHRTLLARLLTLLKLPDEHGQAATDRSTQARRAAMARWGRGG